MMDDKPSNGDEGEASKASIKGGEDTSGNKKSGKKT